MGIVFLNKQNFWKGKNFSCKRVLFRKKEQWMNKMDRSEKQT